MKKLVLYGNGPVAHSAYYDFFYDSSYEVVGFTVDKAFIKNDLLFDLPLVPFEDVVSIFAPDEHAMHIAVGYTQVNRLRAERYDEAKRMGYQLPNFISSRAVAPENISIGDNCRIGINCIVAPSVTIGNNVVIGAGSYVGHDTFIGDHCFVGNHVAISGSVRIGEYSFLGTNVTIRNRINIGRKCVIGAGAVMLQDAKEEEVYLGAQAELLPVTSDELPLK